MKKRTRKLSEVKEKLLLGRDVGANIRDAVETAINLSKMSMITGWEDYKIVRIKQWELFDENYEESPHKIHKSFVNMP